MEDKDEARGDVEQLYQLAIRPHFQLDADDWYSCPKSPDGCLDESQGNDCNCGADVHNRKVEEAYLKSRRATPPPNIDALKALVADLAHVKECPDCPNTGWIAHETNMMGWEHEECMYCRNEPLSQFNLKSRARALVGSEEK